MVQVRCEDLTKLECSVVIESDDLQYVIEQITAHAKGSHGIDITSVQIEELISPKAEIVEPVKEKVVKAKKEKKPAKGWFGRKSKK